MTINRSSILYHYAYFGSDSNPNQTSLCAFFWRCVFRTLLYLVPFVALSFYGYALSVNWQKTLGMTVIFIAFVSLFVALNKLDNNSRAKRLAAEEADLNEWERLWRAGETDLGYKEWCKERRRQNSFLYATFLAFKHRFCPIIKIEG